jgi:hypothetical protein
MNPSRRGDPTWVPPALTRDEQTRNVGKTPVFFGPPLAILTDGFRRTRWRSAAASTAPLNATWS